MFLLVQMKTLNFASEIYWPLVKASLFCLRPFFRTKKTTFARKEWKMVGLFQVERRLKNRNGFSVYKKTRKRFHCIWVSKSTNQFLFFKAQIREQMSGPEISYYEKSILSCGLWSGLDCERKGTGPIMSNFWGWVS